NRLPPGFTAGKILWLKKHEPRNFAELVWILLPHDYINMWLCGERHMEYGDASGTGLLDVKTRRWSRDACRAIGDSIEDALPSLGNSSLPCGKLRPALQSKWGLPDGVIVAAGGGDNMMGAIG